ncbi:hypothetical protein [Sphingobacterium thermophilum]|uniref:Uncharacterized protein n=1 Tax=Sphingobacterium thermophilum TaxID=768534 RepID=A0ABP8QZG2_9SPHI
MEFENLKQQVDELQLNSDLLSSDISRMLPTIISFLEENEKLLQGFHEVREKDLETKSKLIGYINDCHTAIDNYVRDYGNLQALTDNIIDITQKDYLELDRKLTEFKGLVERIPKETEVKHKHSIDFKSIRVVFALIFLLIFSFVSLGVAIGLHQHQKALKADSIKFRMFRQEFPEIGQRIDSIYHADPDRALFILEKLEEEQRLIRSAKQKRREIESAK